MRAVYSKTSDILRLEEMPVVDFQVYAESGIFKSRIKFRVFYDAIKIGAAKLGKVYFELKNAKNSIPAFSNFSFEKSIKSDSNAINKNTGGLISKLSPNQSSEKIAFVYNEVKNKDNPPEISSVKKHEHYDFYNQVFSDKYDPGLGRLVTPSEKLIGNSTQEISSQIVLTSFNYLEFEFEFELIDFLNINYIESSYISEDLKLVDFVEMNFNASSFYEIYKLGFSANDSRGLMQTYNYHYRFFNDNLSFEDSLWENKGYENIDTGFYMKRKIAKDASSNLQSYNFSTNEISIEDSSISAVPFYYDENSFYIKRVPTNGESLSALRIIAIDLASGIRRYSNLQTNVVSGKSITIPNFLISSRNYEILIEMNGIPSSNSLIYQKIKKKFEAKVNLQSFEDFSTMTVKKSGSDLSIICVESISMYDGSNDFSECKLLDSDIKFENLKYDPKFGTAYVIHQIYISSRSIFSSKKDIFSYHSYPHAIKTVYSNPQTIADDTRITAIGVIKTPWNTNIIQWNVDGNLDKIDHFRVYARSELSGIERLLGCTPNVNRFEDKNDIDIPKDLGKITYTVRPVFTNFNAGDEKTIIFEKSSTLPSVFLDDFKQKSVVNFEFYGDSIFDLDLKKETKKEIRISSLPRYRKNITSKTVVTEDTKSFSTSNIPETSIQDSDKLSQIASISYLTDLIKTSQYMDTLTKKF